MKYAYIRVSSKEQNEARQIKCLEKYDIDKMFSEKISGATMERPKLQEMLSVLKSGDTVYITDFSRIAERARKRAMERNESDCCGNCFWFDGEEGDGMQFCDEKQREISENGYCPLYKRKND